MTMHIIFDYSVVAEVEGLSRSTLVSTVRMKQNNQINLQQLSFIFSISIEEQSKKSRKIAIRSERKLNESREYIRVESHCICCCDMGWTGEGVVDSSFWHVNQLRMDTSVMAKVEQILSTGFEERTEGTLGISYC